MMHEKRIGLFETANSKFLNLQSDLITSGVSERTLCGALMLYLYEEIKGTDFSNYYVDVEYNRNMGKVKTIVNEDFKAIAINCDLIIHSRGRCLNEDNLIAIEMKKSTNKKSEKLKDKNRLIALTKDTFDDVWSFDGTTLPEHVCRYGLGVYYEVNVNRKQVTLGTILKVNCLLLRQLNYANNVALASSGKLV
ncbi:hypothetical protein [Paenibacillus sp. MBLB4367]|uniref:hypothetical protein n=1 Tax=Paenibacillus sp. MBLB4367 TaxID=3384767 RepID=UPI00390843DC